MNISVVCRSPRGVPFIWLLGLDYETITAGWVGPLEALMPGCCSWTMRPLQRPGKVAPGVEGIICWAPEIVGEICSKDHVPGRFKIALFRVIVPLRGKHQPPATSPVVLDCLKSITFILKSMGIRITDTYV